jgi:hypothetical protein
MSGSLIFFLGSLGSLQFLPGMLNDHQTVDKESVIAKEVDGVGDKGSGDTTNSQCRAPLVTFMEDFQIWEYFS